MNDDIFLLPRDERPSWLQYPRPFCRLVSQGLVDITPWHLLRVGQVRLDLQGLQKRYPSRELFPFARRQDNDDVACWSQGAGERVFVIHDFASPGWENESTFDDVWCWFRAAIDETIDWE